MLLELEQPEVTFHQFESSRFQLAETIEHGLPTENLAELRNCGLTFTEIATLVIAPRTLKHRRARGERLSHEETDRLVRVFRILALAESIFGNREKALIWLRTPDDRLSNRNPLDLLRTEVGGRLIEEMLWQVDEGIYG